MKLILSNAEYHARGALGSSFIRDIHGTTVAHALIKKRDFKTTDAMKWGSLCHAMLFEPESVEELFTTEPTQYTPPAIDGIEQDAEPINKRLKVHRAFLASWAEENKHKEIVTDQMRTDSAKMIESIMKHPIASKMVTGGEAEYAFFSQDPDLGLEFKCKPDYMKNGALIDLKTSKDASYEEFAREIGKRGYHLQAAYYLDVYNAVMKTDLKEFYFVAVEKVEPFAVATYRLGDADIEAGRAAYKKAIKEYKEYLNEVDNLKEGEDESKALSNHAFPIEIKTISVPFWMLDKIE